MNRLRLWLGGIPRDPVAVSCYAAVALMAFAFAVFLVAWAGASRTLSPPVQVSYLVSGGLGGLAVLIAGAAFLNAQLTRRLAAQERAELDAVLVEARTLLSRVASPDAGAQPARRRRGA